MTLEITGTLIVKGDTQQVSEKFKKREFVLELVEVINGNPYVNYSKMQLVQGKCDILDRHHLGDEVTVSFNIKGNRWERDGKTNYMTNLDAWRIEGAKQSYQQHQPTENKPAHAYTPPVYGHYASAPQQQGAINFGAAPAMPIDDLPF